MFTLEELRAKRDALLAEAEKIVAKEHPTAEDDARLAVIDQEVKGLRAKISVMKAKEDVAAETAADEARSLAEAAANRPQNAGTVVNVGEEKPFANLGEQLMAIMDASKPGGKVDERLYKVMNAASGGNTSIPSEGGWLVQKDFAGTIYQRMYDRSVLAQRCDRTGISEGSDGLQVPYIDETSRATGSRWGGVRVYWKAEADSVTATKPKIGLQELTLEDLMGLAYLTNRSVRDAAALGRIYEKSFGDEMAFTVDDAIFRGTGAGMPLGFSSASCCVEVSKETGQVADTIVAENVINMYARLWSRASNPEWYINQDCIPQCVGMTLTIGTAGVPIWMPANGFSGKPYNTLLGMRVNVIEQCSTVGDAGDIVLADMNEYALIDKDNVQSDVSIHVRFLYNEEAFRLVYRVNGQPKWKSALTPYKGSNTVSPFVKLAARA